MKGTAKQIAWAEDIKAIVDKHCTFKINWEVEYRGSDETQTAVLYRIIRAGMAQAFEEIDDAARIIEHRDEYNERAIDSNVQQAQRLIEAGKLTVAKIAEIYNVKDY